MKAFTPLLPVVLLAMACGGGSDVDAPAGAAGGSNAGSAGSSAAGAAGSGTAGSGTAGSGTAGSGTAGSGTAGSGTAGSGTAGSSGSGTAGSATAGSSAAGAGGKAGSGTAGTSTAGAGGAGTAGSGTAGAGGSALPAGCKDAATAAFDPPNVCNGPGAQTTKEIPSNGIFSTSWFGCYKKADGSIFQDPGDNCEFACGPKGYCPANQPGPECEAALQWFAADADRYGCGAKILVTNCANGKQVVLTTLDRGPNCKSVEMAFGVPVLDMSHPAMTYLFDGKTYGGSDKKRVLVEPAAANAALGPVQ